MSIEFVWSTPGSKLWEAANLGDLEILKRELARPGVDIEVCDNMNRTPLVEAAKYDHPECVRELLLVGADPDHLAFLGKAVDYAGNPVIKQMLNEASAAKARGEKWVPKASPASCSSSQSHKPKVARPCRFFSRGSCKYGNACLFEHDVFTRQDKKGGGSTKTGTKKNKKLAAAKKNAAAGSDPKVEDLKKGYDTDELNEYLGFTKEEYNTLICYGIKPWEDGFDYSYKFLEQLKEEEEKYKRELAKADEKKKEEEEAEQDSEMEERMQHFGFTSEEFNTLICYGVKPWEDIHYAVKFLELLKEEEDESEDEDSYDEIEEMSEHFGFTAEDFHTLICNGIKPWEDWDEAWFFLEQLKKKDAGANAK